MSFQRTLTGGAIAAFVAVASPSLPAQADLYHAVEPGDTLNSVARRYHQTPEAIRTANRLNDTQGNAALPTMLLLIPDSSTTGTVSGAITSKSLPSLAGSPTIALMSSATTVNAPTGKTSEAPAPRRTLGTSGSIVQMTSYVVKAGDTLDSIAQKFSKPGQVVTANDIRRRNYISNEPAPGTMLLVPVGNATYGSAAAAPANSPVPSPEREIGAPIADASEIATVLPRPNAVYQAPGTAFAAANTPRRGSALAARGMGSDEVRMVQPGQETPSVQTAPGPRARVMQVQQQPAASTALANVAKVARSGGTIRRLPDAEAVNLYRCAVGMEIAVIKQSGAWSAILMSDRSTGWIPTKYIQMTGVQVDISTQVITQDSYQGTTNGSFNSSQPVVANALKWLGTPYVYGGTSRRGIDCSALVQSAFRDSGVRLPRTAAQQAKVGAPVDPAQLQPGDRLYFSASGSRVDHTGLYMGNGMFVHASGRGRQVMVSKLTDRAHWNIFVGARR